MERDIAPEMIWDFDHRLVCRSPMGDGIFGSDSDIMLYFKDTPIFREAVYLASRDLYMEAARHLRDGKDPKARLKGTLMKYRNRMLHRSTPFGLFAGVGMVSWSNPIVKEGNRFQRSVRLDSSCLTQLVTFINGRESVKRKVKFLKNNSAYNISSRLKYVKCSNGNTSYKNFTLVSVKRNAGLDDVLRYYRDEPKSVAEITVHLEEIGHAPSDAEEYVRLLIEEGLLVSDFQIRLTHPGDHLDYIIRFIRSFDNDPELSDMATAVGKIQTLITRIERGIDPPDVMVGLYENIRSLLLDTGGIEVPKSFIQVDLYKQPDRHVEIGDKNELLRAFDALMRLTSATSRSFSLFKQRFAEAYGSNPVPLNEVLDPETGIGYPEIVTNKGIASGIKRKSPPHGFEISDLEQFLLKKCLQNSGHVEEIIISEEEVEGFPQRDAVMPTTSSILFSVRDDEESSTFHIKYAHGKSAANVIARFAYGDPEITDLLRTICRHERKVNEGKAVAEVVHFPGMERLGNVMFRHHFRDFEIPYIAISGSEIRTIVPNDLYLWNRENRIILYSKKLNCEVVPYHSCAHNYNYDSLPLYKLLCDLNDQGNRCSFSWGNLQNLLDYFPRVRYKNVIFSPRTWLISLTSRNRTDFLKKLKDKGVPHVFLISEGDNDLVIDVADDSTVPVLDGFLKEGRTITIKEAFFGPNNPTNEYVATLYNRKNRKSNMSWSKKSVPVTKQFNPGSEWVYYKLYVNINTANRVLLEEIQPVVNKLLRRGVVSEWFFIRYADPEHHIRLRLKGNQPAEIISSLKNKIDDLTRKRLIASVSLNSYERELERYGHRGIETAERLFFVQSSAVVKLLTYNLTEIELHLVAMKAMMRTLHNFSFGPDVAKVLCIANRDLLQSEIMFSKKDKLSADKLYRSELRPALKNETGFLDRKVLEILKKLAYEEALVATKLSADLKQDKISRESFCTSIMHMFVNRLYESHNRTHEFLLYYNLAKVYSDYRYLFNDEGFSV